MSLTSLQYEAREQQLWPSRHKNWSWLTFTRFELIFLRWRIDSSKPSRGCQGIYLYIAECEKAPFQCCIKLKLTVHQKRGVHKVSQTPSHNYLTRIRLWDSLYSYIQVCLSFDNFWLCHVSEWCGSISPSERAEPECNQYLAFKKQASEPATHFASNSPDPSLRVYPECCTLTELWFVY